MYQLETIWKWSLALYASLIISGYVIGLCFVVQWFKFTSNEKERQKEKGESHYCPYSGGEIYLANIYCQNEDKRKKLREKEKPLVLTFLLSKFSFVYITKINKLHISSCNKSKCGKCKIAYKVLDSFPAFVQISPENSLSIV